MTTRHSTSKRDDAGLRGGLTTGTCAAAAAKAAALALVGDAPERVQIALPGGDVVTLPIASAEVLSADRARAAVVKDAGDDPDVTNGMTIVAEVALGGDGVRFAAGTGVGTVTRPGLLLDVGEPAINPVPREMIAEALAKVLGDRGALVTVSIPGGDEVAEGTFNPRLGIQGGLSVIGTSGRVVPKSSEAWMRSLLPQVDVALAAGHRDVWLTTGGRGDVFATGTLGAPESAVVQASNFIGALLDKCADAGVARVILVGHAGKLLKVAAGVFDTHSRTGDARMEALASIAAAEGAPNPLAARLLDAPTVEAAVGELAAAGLADVWDAVARRVAVRSSQRCGLPVEVALIGYHDELLGATANVPGVEAARAATAPARAATAPPRAATAQLAVVGVGPGAEDTLTPAAWRAIRRADLVVGGRRQLAAFAPGTVECIELGADVEGALRALGDALETDDTRRAVVLASGDPGFFGVLEAVRRVLPNLPVAVHPGISSIQVAAARLGRSWSGATLASAHGRDAADVLDACASARTVFALCDRAAPSQHIAALAAEREPGAFDACVVERAGLSDESVTCGSAEAIAQGTFDPLSVVVIERKGDSR